MARRNSTLGRSVLDLDIDDSAFHSKLSGAYKAANKFTANAGASMAKAGKAISGVGDSMTRNITLPILAAGGAVAHFALDFDTTMRRIVGLAKVPKEAIAGVREEILKMGAEVGRSPQELGEAFYFVASAGFEADEAMEVLRVSAKAAASGMGLTQDVAKVLGGVINAYGHENLSAARAGDILTAAIQDGSAEAADFAGVIGRVAPGAAALGVSFDQVAAALSGMTNVGISADEAATSLVQIFSALIKTTPQAEDALKGLGLSSAGLRQELREKGLLEALRTLEQRFGNNETAAAAVFGNIRALRGITALLALDTDQLNSIFADTAGALNTLDGAYADTEGPQRALDRSMAKLQATAIELGADVLPLLVDVLAKVADAAAGLGEWWKGLDEGTRELIVSTLAWLAITGPVLIVLGKLTSGAGALLKVITFLGGAKGIPALAGALKGLGVVGLGVVGIAGALVLGLDAATPAVSDFFDELFAGKKANKVLHELNDLTGDMLKAQVLRSWGISVKQFAKVVERAGGNVEDAFNAIKDNAGDVGKALDQLSANSDTAGGLFSGWGDRSPAAIEAALEKGRQIAAEKAGEIPKVVSAALEDGQWQVEQAAEELPDPIAEALEKAKQAVADAANDLIHTLATTLASHPKELLDAAKEMWDDILHPFPDIKQRLTIEAILARKDWIRGLTSTDSGDRARTAEYLKGLLADYELLAPGAMAAGELINPALQAGIDRTLGALLTYLETQTGDIVNEFDLADEFDRMGYESLAAYLRGLKRAADLAQLERVMAPFRDFIEAKLGFSGSPLFSHAEELGAGVGKGYMHTLADTISGLLPALAAVIPNLGPDIGMPAMPAVDALGMPGGGMASAGGGGFTTINNTWTLQVGGVPYEFKTRDDFIKALDDVARFGADGRLPSDG